MCFSHVTQSKGYATGAKEQGGVSKAKESHLMCSWGPRHQIPGLPDLLLQPICSGPAGLQLPLQGRQVLPPFEGLFQLGGCLQVGYLRCVLLEHHTQLPLVLRLHPTCQASNPNQHAQSRQVTSLKSPTQPRTGYQGRCCQWCPGETRTCPAYALLSNELESLDKHYSVAYLQAC